MENYEIKEKKFVHEYIKSLNAGLSAKKAGFNTTDFVSLGEQLLLNNSVIKEIKYQLKLQISTLQIPKSYIIKKLVDIAEFSLEEEEILDKDGGYTGKKKFRDATNGLRALEYLCKHLGFASNENVENEEIKIITINNLDEEKI